MALTRRPSGLEKGLKFRQEQYRARYEKFKKRGRLFWPHIIIEDALVSLGVFIILLLLAVFAGVPLEERADPTNTAYIPRPEWYFMWIFQLLKVFPGYLEWAGVVALPAVGVIILLALPFLDRNVRRMPQFRPIALTLGGLGLAGVALFTYVAFSTAPPRAGVAGLPGQEVRLTAVQLAGRQLYNAQCAVCHSLGGKGGTTAPPLDGVTSRMDPAYVHIYIEDPKAINPFSQMPAFLKYPDVKLLTHEQVAQIVEYLKVYK